MVFVGACADYPLFAGGLADSYTGVAAVAVAGTLGETIDTTAAAVLVQVGPVATPAGCCAFPVAPVGSRHERSPVDAFQ